MGGWSRSVSSTRKVRIPEKRVRCPSQFNFTNCLLHVSMACLAPSRSCKCILRPTKYRYNRVRCRSHSSRLHFQLRWQNNFLCRHEGVNIQYQVAEFTFPLHAPKCIKLLEAWLRVSGWEEQAHCHKNGVRWIFVVEKLTCEVCGYPWKFDREGKEQGSLATSAREGVVPVMGEVGVKNAN